MVFDFEKYVSTINDNQINYSTMFGYCGGYQLYQNDNYTQNNNTNNTIDIKTLITPAITGAAEASSKETTPKETTPEEIANINATIREYYQLCAITKMPVLSLINQIKYEPTDVLFTKKEVELLLTRDKRGWRVAETVIGAAQKNKTKIMVL